MSGATKIMMSLNLVDFESIRIPHSELAAQVSKLDFQKNIGWVIIVVEKNQIVRGIGTRGRPQNSSPSFRLPRKRDHVITGTRVPRKEAASGRRFTMHTLYKYSRVCEEEFWTHLQTNQ